MHNDAQYWITPQDNSSSFNVFYEYNPSNNVFNISTHLSASSFLN